MQRRLLHGFDSGCVRKGTKDQHTERRRRRDAAKTFPLAERDASSWISFAPSSLFFCFTFWCLHRLDPSGTDSNGFSLSFSEVRFQSRDIETVVLRYRWCFSIRSEWITISRSYVIRWFIWFRWSLYGYDFHCLTEKLLYDFFSSIFFEYIFVGIFFQYLYRVSYSTKDKVH